MTLTELLMPHRVRNLTDLVATSLSLFFQEHAMILVLMGLLTTQIYPLYCVSICNQSFNMCTFMNVKVKKKEEKKKKCVGDVV